MTNGPPFDHVHSWIWDLDSDPNLDIPPFVLELVLRDSRVFFVRYVIAVDENSKTLGIRTWDLRALDDDDIKHLKENIAIVDDYSSPTDLHPKLDQSNLRIPLDAIWYCVEHHNRFWPESVRSQVGFAIDDA